MIYLLSLLFLSGDRFYNFPESYKPSKEYALKHEIGIKYINDIEKNGKFVCSGTGGGGAPATKNTHYFSFNYFEEKSLDEARKMLLELIDEAVMTFNANKEYEQYHPEGPYTYKNFEICLFFRKPDGGFGDEEKFSGCCSNNGRIHYSNRLLGDKRILLRETYEEAKAKLAEEKKS